VELAPFRRVVQDVARETVRDGIPLPQWQEDELVNRILDGVSERLKFVLTLDRRLAAIEERLARQEQLAGIARDDQVVALRPRDDPPGYLGVHQPPV
jgi:hypothetical protein